MKIFSTDKPILRYTLLFFGAVMGSITGAVAATILVAYLLR